MGGLDVLVNSAGVGDGVSIEDTTEEIWDSTLGTLYQRSEKVTVTL